MFVKLSFKNTLKTQRKGEHMKTKAELEQGVKCLLCSVRAKANKIQSFIEDGDIDLSNARVIISKANDQLDNIVSNVNFEKEKRKVVA